MMDLQEEFLLMFDDAIDDSIEDFDLTEDYYPEHTLWWEEKDFDAIETYNISKQQLVEFDWQDE